MIKKIIEFGVNCICYPIFFPIGFVQGFIGVFK